MNRRHEPLDPEERALARRLADEAMHEPSAELDARILAAAREPVRPEPRAGGSRRSRSRWPLALGLAASVTLAVGVAWQLREPPRPAVAPAPAAAPLADAPDDAPVSREAADAADAADAAKAIAPAPPPAPPAGDTTPSRAAEGSAAAAGTDAAQEHRAAVAAATTRSAQRQEKALRQAEMQAATDAAIEAERTRKHQAAVAAAAQRSAQRGEKAARQAASAEPAYAPPPAPAQDIAAPRPADVYQAPSPPAPPAPVADTGATIDALSAESAVPHEARSQSLPVPRAVFAEPAAVLSGAAAAAVEADARLPPAQWLQRIREHRDQGDAALARASLARFVRDHAGVPVPDDLQSLAP